MPKLHLDNEPEVAGKRYTVEYLLAAYSLLLPEVQWPNTLPHTLVIRARSGSFFGVAPEHLFEAAESRHGEQIKDGAEVGISIPRYCSMHVAVSHCFISPRKPKETLDLACLSCNDWYEKPQAQGKRKRGNGITTSSTVVMYEVRFNAEKPIKQNTIACPRVNLIAQVHPPISQPPLSVCPLCAGGCSWPNVSPFVFESPVVSKCKSQYCSSSDDNICNLLGNLLVLNRSRLLPSSELCVLASHSSPQCSIKFGT